jgi:hypothetical protein
VALDVLFSGVAPCHDTAPLARRVRRAVPRTALEVFWNAEQARIASGTLKGSDEGHPPWTRAVFEELIEEVVLETWMASRLSVSDAGPDVALFDCLQVQYVSGFSTAFLTHVFRTPGPPGLRLVRFKQIDLRSRRDVGHRGDVHFCLRLDAF